jgi:hypothetical protein
MRRRAEWRFLCHRDCPMLQIHVCIYLNVDAFDNGELPIIEYTMDHDNAIERGVLGRQCRAAFEAGQVVLTYPFD